MMDRLPKHVMGQRQAAVGTSDSFGVGIDAYRMRPAGAAFVALAVIVTGVASYFAFSPAVSGTLAFWGVAGGPTLVLAAAAGLWAHREDYLAEWLGPKWGDFTRGLAGAAILFGLSWAFVHLVAPVGSPREVWLVSLYGQLGDPRVLQRHAAQVAAAVAVVALCEELVWRGAVTQLLATRFGSRAAWIWAAGLYALSYVPTAWALRSTAGSDPVLVFAALAGGLLWGGMARAFGRLAPGILAHALYDWAVIMMFPLWGRG
jgi:membrane protease YdiL (CAAX protease family)